MVHTTTAPYVALQAEGGNGSPEEDQDGRLIEIGSWYVAVISYDCELIVAGPYGSMDEAEAAAAERNASPEFQGANRILVHLGRESWLATHRGPHAASVYEIFSTTTIPLPWTLQAHPGDVLKDLATRNPTLLVALGEP